MRTFNRVTLLARVVGPPRDLVESGTVSIRFAVETRRLPSDDAGDVDRHTIVCWGKLGDWVLDHLGTGMVVLVDGRLVYRDVRPGSTVAEVHARDINLIRAEDLL